MSQRFTCETTPIAGLTVVHRHPRSDARGSFERLFCPVELAACGFPGPVAQVNRSRTVRPGAVRGMHLQRPPHAEWKHITCLSGAVRDVVVDLRRGSPSFLAWHAVELSASRSASLLVPPGCAHGFQVTDGPAEMLYLHSQPYAPESDAGVRSDDPRIGIAWPLPVTERSDRDAAHPLLTESFQGFEP